MAVEAALVIPMLCLLVFGMIEFSFALRDYAGVASLTRTGARIASTGADAGKGTCETGADAPPCTPAQAPALAQLAADAVQRAGSATNPDQIEYILVYKANDAGYPGVASNKTMPSSCAGITDCVKYVWRPAQDGFRFNSGSWNSATISACFPGSGANALDRVGIYLRANHKMMTGLFGTSIAISDRAVMDFEPLPTQTCGTNMHP